MTVRGQLDGIRVLDLSRVLAGPMAAQMLGDLGAEVIKVERPGSGDESRQYGPPFLETPSGTAKQESAFYISANRNKHSITLDLSQAEGQKIAHELALQSDVLIENFRVGTLKKYGLDYETLAAHNPKLIYCSITGYGQTGPYRDRPGYDAVFQAMSGLMQSIGHPDGEPGGGPMRTGMSITDIFTSLYADIAIISALYARDANGGQGEYIDMALLDSATAAMSHYASLYLISGKIPPRRGNAGNGGVPSQVFQCADGMIILTVGNDSQFKRFCVAIGRPELSSDPRFSTGPARIIHRDEIVALLTAIFVERTAKEWLHKLVDADIVAAPIYDLAETFADPQVISRGLEKEVTHALGGQLRMVGNPILYRNRPIGAYSSPPLLGEQTDSVLRDLLGYDENRIGELRRNGVV